MRWFTLVLLLTAVACQSDKHAESLGKLEKAYEADPTDDNFLALLQAYTSHFTPDPKRPEAKEVMERAADFSAKVNRHNAAISFLNTLIKEYPDDPETPDRIAEMANHLEELGKVEATNVIKRAFLKAYPDHPVAKSYASELDERELPLDTVIQRIGLKMFEPGNKGIDQSMARAYVDACEAYVLVLPDDPKAVDYLQKASEMARTLQDIEKALSLYDWIIEEYPQHPKAPQALFLKAFTFDNNLNDYDNARKYYEEFLSRYPDDDFADDTKFLLDNLGKSDEDILKTLQDKGEAQ